MDKKTHRTMIRKKRQELSSAYRSMADKKICENIISLPAFQEASTVFCYIHTAYEIHITPILEYCWAHDKKTVVPKCIDKGIMEAYEIHSFDDLCPGSYGILEPKPACPQAAKSSIDFAVIPCLSCDPDKWRLGQGGGYYDRYLENASFVKAAVCQDQLLSNSVFHDTHDIPMDFVVTESKIYV